ncbi:MAG: rod shape-determining protein MreD [Rhodothermales bacterium]|nr:rod shape-determining protein MreD [Rhodothermales bacterium]MBO6779466.1 rod shape-determining protein MreD [Rhodothermales bacterium]
MLSPFRTILAGVLVVAAQWLVFSRLRLWGVYPDVALLFVAWVGIRRGRRAGALAGFGTGFLLDFAYGTWGLQMLVKTIVGFLVGLFPAAERESLLILPRQALVGGLVIALVQNGILVTLLALQTGSSDPFLVTGLWLGGAAYTAFVGTLSAIIADR